jgi:hypothetical protein
MKTKITYVNIGRNNFNGSEEFDCKTENLQDAVQSCETKAFNEVQKYLMSSIVGLSPNEEEYAEKNTYDVCVGDFGRVVGKVIIEVKKK